MSRQYLRRVHGGPYMDPDPDYSQLGLWFAVAGLVDAIIAWRAIRHVWRGVRKIWGRVIK